VHFSGNVGSSSVSSCPQLNGEATAFLQFTHGSAAKGNGVPNEWINVTVASNGAWGATFVIPSFVGGQAMTVGSQGADVTSGMWTFFIPTCGDVLAPQVSFRVTSPSPPPSSFTAMAASPDGRGYWLTQAQGGVYSFGDAPFYGSLPGIGVTPAAPITGMAAAPGGGYWLVGADGGVFAFGNAHFYGSLPGDHVTPFGAIVGITATHDGGGYWLVGADGGAFAFGDAAYVGSGNNGVPRVALLATADGGGYVLPSSTGQAPAAYGDAPTTFSSEASSGPMPLDALVTGGAMAPGSTGHWLVGADGGVFAFGSAPFDGSLPGIGVTPAAPITSMAAAPGGGYWLLGADGGVFAFGGAGFYGSASATSVLLAGNGVASARFGQSQSSAIDSLDQVMGSPVKGPIDMAGNCNVDTAEQWSTLTAYFDQGAFVGYGTWAANGEPLPAGNFETAMGLRVGDTITQAEQLYGSAFQTFLAQGGSWSVTTPEGNLIGYLSAEPNKSGPPPTISSIAAGSVGCPAVTP
jgi:hypothetical protein